MAFSFVTAEFAVFNSMNYVTSQPFSIRESYLVAMLALTEKLEITNIKWQTFIDL